MNLYPNTRGTSPRNKDKKIRVATHLDVIKLCLERIGTVKFIVEHGMGIASTPFFHSIPELQRLLSFENEKQWQKCDSCPSQLEHIIAPAPQNNDFKSVIEKQIVGLVDSCFGFVDGPGPERFCVLKTCIELDFPFIVEHDAETLDISSLNDRKILVGEREYVMYQYVANNPETMLYVNLKKKLNVNEYLKYEYIIV